MSNWTVYLLAPDLKVRVEGEMPPLSPAAESRVATLWAEACRAAPSLFNGRVLSVVAIEPERLTCRWTEYRRVAAQLRDPRLYGVLGMRPLAVCGPLISPDGVVLGRREAGSIYLPGYWQAPPAGNVDARAVRGDCADWRASLLAELHEELGLGPDAVTALRPACAIEHPGTHVVDIACRIDTRLGETAIRAAHATARDREIDALRLVPVSELKVALAALAPRVMGVVPASLAALGLLERFHPR